MQPRPEPVRGSRGRLAGALVVLGLVGIAATLVVRQLHRPAWREPLATPTAPGPTSLAPCAAPWVAVGEPEVYDPTTLYQKIDGQADLYLQAGFRQLECQRFADPEDLARNLELCLYTLSDAAAARSVHARQARPGAVPLRSDLRGGCAGGSCFLALAAWYLEVLPSTPGEELAARSREVALAFAASHSVPDEEAPALFPAEGLLADSAVEEVQDAYGMDSLDGVATATYAGERGPLLAWMARRDDGAALVTAVRAELRALGGVEQPGEDGAVRVEILGSTCVLIEHPRGVVGVWEAADAAAADALARRLAAALGEPAP